MPGLLQRFAPPAGLLAIVCYHCGREQEVGRRAQTVTCRHCSKALQVSDVQVKRYDARREIRTVGTLVVEKKGRVVAHTIECGGLVARGEVRSNGGTTTVRGPVLAGPTSSLVGRVFARTMNVSDGATLEGDFCVGKDHMAPPPPPAPETQAAGDAGLGAESMPSSASVDAPAR